MLVTDEFWGTVVLWWNEIGQFKFESIGVNSGRVKERVPQLRIKLT